MKEELFNLFLFVKAGLAWWFLKDPNDQSLGMLEREARMVRRGIFNNGEHAAWGQRGIR